MVNELIASIILAVVQGLTEWIPVSSSGHLVIFEKILNFKGSLMFDVALHFGTLMAIFVYFGSEIVDIARDLLTGKWKTENSRLGILLVIATIPAAIVGFFLKDIFERVFANLGILALGFATTGLFLIIASVSEVKKKDLNYKTSLSIGLAQIFSLFPGISRSGTTLGAGLLLGLDEKSALKFSFLMSIPIIFGANILAIGSQKLPPNLIWATIVSFVIGLITIHLLYGKILTKKKNLKWFGIYTLAIAILLGGYLLWA